MICYRQRYISESPLYGSVPCINFTETCNLFTLCHQAICIHLEKIDTERNRDSFEQIRIY